MSDVEDTLPQALPIAKSKNLACQHQGHHESERQEHFFRRTQSEPGQQWSRVSSGSGGMSTDVTDNFRKPLLDSSISSQAPQVKRPNSKMTQREKICAGQQRARYEYECGPSCLRAYRRMHIPTAPHAHASPVTIRFAASDKAHSRVLPSFFPCLLAALHMQAWVYIYVHMCRHKMQLP